MDNTANTVLTKELLEWADTVVVMEKTHRSFIQKKYKEIYNTKKITCLYIPDEYDFMQQELIEVLKYKVESVCNKGLL